MKWGVADMYGCEKRMGFRLRCGIDVVEIERGSGSRGEQDWVFGMET